MKKGALTVMLLAGCLAIAGCSSGATEGNENMPESAEPQVRKNTVAYDFAGYQLDIPEDWQADTEASEADKQIIFRLEDKKGTLLIMKDDIPQFMTVKSEGSDIVEATDEEIAENYIFSSMESDLEQTVGEMEVIDCGDFSYMRKTFGGTIRLADIGEIKAVQRTALLLNEDNSGYIEVMMFCPEEQEGSLEDVDGLMKSIISQM